MRRDTFTIDRTNYLTLEVVLNQYLSQFTVSAIEAAVPTSQLANARQMWNRCRNIAHGCDVEYMLDRAPTRLHPDYVVTVTY